MVKLGRDIAHLEEMAKEVRKDIVEMTYLAHSGHPGGSLSSVEILVSLYFSELNQSPETVDSPDRDRFVLSKGHITPAFYSVLSHAGYIPHEELKQFRKVNSRLQGHPASTKLKGIEVSTGSLGQGLSVAIGIALAGKIDKRDYRVYCLVGDGEMEEGQIWEAIMFAGNRHLNNLILFLDYNGLQIDGEVAKINDIAPVISKFEAFKWHTFEINGHSFDQIFKAIDEAKRYPDNPTAIIAHTVKGKGISFMENAYEWHGKAPNEEQYKQAMKELNANG